MLLKMAVLQFSRTFSNFCKRYIRSHNQLKLGLFSELVLLLQRAQRSLELESSAVWKATLEDIDKLQEFLKRTVSCAVVH